MLKYSHNKLLITYKEPSFKILFSETLEEPRQIELPSAEKNKQLHPLIYQWVQLFVLSCLSAVSLVCF